MFKKLIQWSHDNYNHLPWRKNRSLYGTLVSEVMLQQTTVSTVLNHFDRFMEKYPDVSSLAAITEEQIVIDWKGLGYYRRARNLLKAAKQIQEKFDGVVPENFEDLTSINGIGDYTANAILSIGGDNRAIAIDANLERVLSRIYGIEEFKGPKLQKEIYRLFSAQEICNEIEEVGARNYNEALMDLGRSICKARSAACDICALYDNCVAGKSGEPLKFPKEKEQKKEAPKNLVLNLLRVIVKEDDKVLAYKKDKTEWLSGQYEIPTFILESEDEKLSQYPWLMDENLLNLPSYKTAITKYKISNFVLHASKKDLKELNNDRYEWVSADHKNFSTATLKAFKI